jgi:hypothetical protein
MATTKQTRGRRTETMPSARGRKAGTSKKTLRQLYARLEKTQPGSEGSKCLSGKIVDAIG